MGRSRYAGVKVIDGNHYATWKDPMWGDPFGPDILDGVATVDHVLQVGERLDSLAARYYGDEEYWWVVALANRVTDPFRLTPGTLLRVPTNVKDILDRLRT